MHVFLCMRELFFGKIRTAVHSPDVKNDVSAVLNIKIFRVVLACVLVFNEQQLGGLA